MANPQLENGYTRIANELLEAIILFPFTGAQYKLILALIRKTYGFHKKEDVVSHGQYVAMTGLNRRTVQRELKKLQGMNVFNSRAIKKDWSRWIDDETQFCIHPDFLRVIERCVESKDYKLIDKYFNERASGIGLQTDIGQGTEGGLDDAKYRSTDRPSIGLQTAHKRKKDKKITARARASNINIIALTNEIKTLRDLKWDDNKIKQHLQMREIPEAHIDKALGKHF